MKKRIPRFLSYLYFLTEEVILNEDRTTEDERRYIMEARKRAMLKRKKLRTLGKSRSTESEDEEEEEEGNGIWNIRLNKFQYRIILYK